MNGKAPAYGNVGDSRQEVVAAALRAFRTSTRLLEDLEKLAKQRGTERFGMTLPNVEDLFGSAPELARVPWRAPDPRRMPALRGMVAQWLKAEGSNFYLEMIESGTQQMGLDLAMTPEDAAKELARCERQRVADGALYWVSPAMTQLAVHAGQQLPSQELYPYDLPSPRGFMVFGEPLGMYSSQVLGYPVEIAAVSWGPWEGPADRGNDWNEGGVWMTFWAPQPHMRYISCRQTAVDLGLGGEDPLLPDNEAGGAFGQLHTLEVPAESTGVWARTVRAAWLLMQQPIAETASAAAPPSVKAKLRRAKIKTRTGGVQILRMRPRERGTGQKRSASGYRWTHQVEVPGFWRRYHVGPGRERVEYRWIDPYIAGPADKPIRNLDKVRVWDR
jgi:hypothetical protein